MTWGAAPTLVGYRKSLDPFTGWRIARDHGPADRRLCSSVRQIIRGRTPPLAHTPPPAAECGLNREVRAPRKRRHDLQHAGFRQEAFVSAYPVLP